MPWWGEGLPPWKVFPNVTIKLEANWVSLDVKFHPHSEPVWTVDGQEIPDWMGENRGYWESTCGKYYFDRESAANAAAFFPECLTHGKGEFAGRPFTLEPWEDLLIVRPVFGWKNKTTGLRRFRKVYIEIPKKNGKSQFSAGLGVYMTFCDGEQGSEVYCLDPKTRILHSDFRWKPIGEVEVGDRLIAFDEEPPGEKKGDFRKLRSANVESVQRIFQPCYRINFEDGSIVTASANHRWFAKRYLNGTEKGWVATRDLKIGSSIRKLVSPWAEDRTYDAGYLAGVFDGEANFHIEKTGGSFRIDFAQNPGTVLDLTKDLLCMRGFDISEDRQMKNCKRFELAGIQDCFRFLGTIRPQRLLEKAVQWYEGKAPNHVAGYCKITAIEFVGEQEVVAIGTSTRTLFAEGFFSHNCAAADREQAAIVFEEAKRMVEDCSELAERAICYRRSIVYHEGNSLFKVLSSDAATKHGPNIHCLIFDELHAQPDRTLFETLEKGIAARRQPLIVMITTSGDDTESLCYEQHEYADSVMKDGGDDTFLPVLFNLTKEDDWTNLEVLRRVNPCLGVTVKEEYILNEINAAIKEPRKQNSFKQLHCNIWTQQAKLWIPIEKWDACKYEGFDSFEEFLEKLRQGGKLPLVAGGLDLSSKTDLSSFVLAFKISDSIEIPGWPLPVSAKPVEVVLVPEQEEPGKPNQKKPAVKLKINFRVILVPFFWMPDESLTERKSKDRFAYDMMQMRGLIEVTPGQIIDYDAIYNRITEESPRYKLKGGEIGYDPWNATQLSTQLEKDGFKMIEIPQTMNHLTESSKVFEALVLSKRILHSGHRVLRWNVENVSVKEDDTGNIKPIKPSKMKRIDGVVGSILAISRLMTLKEAPTVPQAVWV